ncbi:MAG: chorismate synthase [Deltaproteobacteria bacterium]|jgi:chorismate synthase|nr:chorismate synthase [Deltaproteobacteria bacterium]MBW2531807.1 chorismate synthase [Deltaproteobacteria bacterium]
MNSFGRHFRVSIFGESHGPSVGVVVDGCPAGIPLDRSDLEDDLRRRMPGAKGTTSRREPDVPIIESGLARGRTTGAPITVRFANRDVDSGPYDQLADTPRPGHADFAARAKYGQHYDHRGGGHLSGRLTVGLVAAGAIAKKLIAPVSVRARILEVDGSEEIDAAVADAVEASDSVGGIVECTARGVPAGLGEPFFDSAESLLSHIVFSIGGIRGIEFGAGFAAARMRGSECNDPILSPDGATATNHAGGINGGITNGNDLCFRVAVKPTSSIAVPQQTVNLATGEPVELSVEGRHDACIALRMPVILEAATAIVLCDLQQIHRQPHRGS